VESDLGYFAQAVLVLRWFLDGTRLAQLAVDNTIGAFVVHDPPIRIMRTPTVLRGMDSPD
jgi:hypothetical protein